eukprot:TRINITY_DN6837_c0_g1_i1.p1 TRINITY_DN6837_c0_g1~~TRINITY_DN6837_c0_g1_i1.p1  ORF type:complete len:393 (-),score=53.15 TRINITY_DN6837_c0_g1_i1:64-1221(-)
MDSQCGISADLWQPLSCRPWRALRHPGGGGAAPDLLLKWHFAERAYAFLATDLTHIWTHESGPRDIGPQLAEMCPHLDGPEALCSLLRRDLDPSADPPAALGVEFGDTPEQPDPPGPAAVLRAVAAILAEDDVTDEVQRRIAQKLSLASFDLSEATTGIRPFQKAAPLTVVIETSVQLAPSIVLPVQWKVRCAPASVDVSVPRFLVDHLAAPLAGMVAGLGSQVDQLKLLLLAKDRELRHLRARDGEVFLPGEYDRAFLSGPLLAAGFDAATFAHAEDARLALWYAAYMRHRQGLPPLPCGQLTTDAPGSPSAAPAASSYPPPPSLPSTCPPPPEKVPLPRLPSDAETPEQRGRRLEIEEEIAQKKRRMEEKAKSTALKIAKALR